MRKIFCLLLVIISCLFFAPSRVLAEDSTYTTLNLEDTLKEEEIEYDFSNYKEDDTQITIYLFRGKGCTYCREFLNFLNSIVDDYGKYFKLVSYEVWYNEENSNLMGEVSEYLNEPAGGVPYIIIGDKVFAGYSSNYDEEIKTAIKDLYDSKDRYDVFEEMKNNSKDEKNTSSNFSVIIFNLIVTTLAVVAIILYDGKKRNELVIRIEDLENKVNKKKSKN